MSTTASLSKLHEKAVMHARRLQGHMARVSEITGGMVETTMGLAASELGAASAVGIDFYLGEDVAHPEAMIGPVPVVVTLAVAASLVSLAAVREPWAKYLASYGAGLGAAGTYAMGMRYLKNAKAAA